VAAVRFRGGHGSTDPEATWFCTSLGILRFAEGQLSHWGENDGLDSETCHDLEIAVDGGVWVATEKGVARFDGKSWRRVGGVVTGRPPPEIRWPPDRDGDGAAARALVLSGRVLWAGTSRGLWPLAPGIGPINRTNGLVDDDVIKLASDRFGRIWALGQVGVTIRRPF
jgi:ligand-binding sensor domain-containing protein